MPTPPAVSKKSERDARRAEKVAEFQRKQRSAKRKRLIAWIASGVGVAAVLGLIAVIIVSSIQPKVDPDSITVEGLQTWDAAEIPSTHVQTAVDYEAEYGMNPPAGGAHNQVWLNCGVYTEPQQNENAVHALEHGAVWITYDPELITGDDLERLQDEAPSTYSVVSPYPGLPAPVVISAWGAQVQLDGVDDPRIQQFIDKFWKSADAPEPGASCTGAIDGPGRIS
jgi:hypothetical protein